MITKLGTVAISVHDQRKAIDFYVNKLGMELVTDAPGGFGEGENSNWVEVAPAGAQTRIVLTPAAFGGEPGSFAPVTLTCDNAEATCAEFRERGVEISHEVETQFWGKFFQFKDLYGNEFLISEAQA